MQSLLYGGFAANVLLSVSVKEYRQSVHFEKVMKLGSSLLLDHLIAVQYQMPHESQMTAQITHERDVATDMI